MKRMKLNDIKITSSFRNSKPNENKMQDKRILYKAGRKISPIVVDGSETLINGYMTYLIMKELGVEYVKVSTRGGKCYLGRYFTGKPTYYLYGLHSENNKEYTWFIPEKKIDEIIGQVLPGDNVLVNTKRGKKIVTVTRIELSENPPVKSSLIMSVIRKV